MDSSTTYVTTKDGFEVILSKTDCELGIEAEDQGSGQTYSAKFPNDAIKSMTQDLFESISELFEGLLTAFEGVSEDTGVRVQQGGKLLFTQKLKIGKHEKVFSFTIPLKIVEVDPINRLEKQVKKLFREVEELKKENQKLKEKLLNEDYERVSPALSTSATYSNQFKISNDKKTVSRHGQNNGYNDGSFYLLGSEESLSKEKNSKFEAKIDSLRGTIAIGVATKNVLQNQSSVGTSGCYCLYSPNLIYENSSQKTWSHYSNLALGSIVGFLYVPSKGEIMLDINGTHIYTIKIEQIHQNAELYPFIGMTPGSKVSFM